MTPIHLQEVAGELDEQRGTIRPGASNRRYQLRHHRPDLSSDRAFLLAVSRAVCGPPASWQILDRRHVSPGAGSSQITSKTLTGSAKPFGRTLPRFRKTKPLPRARS